jgi:hypothetical protein
MCALRCADTWHLQSQSSLVCDICYMHLFIYTLCTSSTDLLFCVKGSRCLLEAVRKPVKCRMSCMPAFSSRVRKHTYAYNDDVRPTRSIEISSAQSSVQCRCADGSCAHGGHDASMLRHHLHTYVCLSHVPYTHTQKEIAHTKYTWPRHTHVNACAELSKQP